MDINSPERPTSPIVKPVISVSVSQHPNEKGEKLIDKTWIVNPQNDPEHPLVYKILKATTTGQITSNKIEPFNLDHQNTPQIKQLLYQINNLSQNINESHIVSFVRPNDALKLIKSTLIFSEEDNQTMVEIGQRQILFSPILEALKNIFTPELELSDEDKKNFAIIMSDYLQGKKGELELTSLVIQNQETPLNYQELIKAQLQTALLNYAIFTYKDFIEAKSKQTQPNTPQQQSQTESPLTIRIRQAKISFFEEIRKQYLELLKSKLLVTNELETEIEKEIRKRNFDPNEFWEYIRSSSNESL